jgi:hypothetical protein
MMPPAAADVWANEIDGLLSNAATTTDNEQRMAHLRFDIRAAYAGAAGATDVTLTNGHEESMNGAVPETSG